MAKLAIFLTLAICARPLEVHHPKIGSNGFYLTFGDIYVTTTF